MLLFLTHPQPLEMPLFFNNMVRYSLLMIPYLPWDGLLGLNNISLFIKLLKISEKFESPTYFWLYGRECITLVMPTSCHSSMESIYSGTLTSPMAEIVVSICMNDWRPFGIVPPSMTILMNLLPLQPRLVV